ncbi:hypothetical protein DPMN_189265 [Dreissena polymorpha]|uniref:Apple domain-containing protein n=1 Tax=Dreissena polymorpha TaxID=45954 RepID=A0A9D4IC22_DREPO|nr:hypothetical protein DPMN_189265 [Dreissena polymorpha]
MADCKFQLRLTIVGLLLVALGTLEYTLAATASNVALGKPANQTDTANGADPSRAVDGNSSTCWATASTAVEWTLDLNNYYNIEEVSIQGPGSQWVTSVGAHSTANTTSNPPENIIGDYNRKWWYGALIEVAFAEKVRLSGVDIYEAIGWDAAGVGEIKCYVEDGWETVWNTTSKRIDSGVVTFSPNLTKPCSSSRLKLTVAPGYPHTYIDAVRIHGIPIGEAKLEMGLTHGKNEAENIMNLSTNSTATWSPDNKGPYRYLRIQANPKNETLSLCEVQVQGQLQQRTPYFQVATGIAMPNPPISTVFDVMSKTECAFVCLRKTKPECVTAQFDQATSRCALYNGFEHNHDPSNGKITIVFKFAAHFFAN